ncbi:MAG: hypothetical protein AB3N14_09850 [Flavobacteriaceae bacterium]
MIQIPGWILLIYLTIAQGVSAISYEYGVAMGTQEPAERITEVGTAFWYGFAFGDLLIYIPVLLVGLLGHILNKFWGRAVMLSALGITVYWPIVCLASIFAARKAQGWNLESETQYWIVLPIICAWGIFGIVAIMRESDTDTGGDETN